MSWVIYDFSHMFICLLSFCHGLPKEEIVRTYMFHLLRTYVILLCNWLILWQNTLYLYLDRSRMCLILQKTCCSSLILKPWRLDQEISEEKLFIKAGQITRHLRTDSSTPLDSWWIDRESSCLLDSSSIASRYLYLSRFKARHLFDTSRSIEVTWIQISKSDFQPKLMHLCRVSFFTTLDLY